MMKKLSAKISATVIVLLIVVAGVYYYNSQGNSKHEQAGHFWAELNQLCGSAYEGKITANSSSYPFIQSNQKIIAHARICRRDRIKISLHVLSTNERLWDRSRTLLVTRSENDRFNLRHLNRQPDGRLTGYSMYGGPGTGSGRNGLLQFVSDAESEIHDRWEMKVTPGKTFTYGSKKNDEWTFRVDFDLMNPLEELPPAPWGVGDASNAREREITLEDGTVVVISCQI